MLINSRFLRLHHDILRLQSLRTDRSFSPFLATQCVGTLIFLCLAAAQQQGGLRPAPAEYRAPSVADYSDTKPSSFSIKSKSTITHRLCQPGTTLGRNYMQLAKATCRHAQNNCMQRRRIIRQGKNQTRPGPLLCCVFTIKQELGTFFT